MTEKQPRAYFRHTDVHYVKQVCVSAQGHSYTLEIVKEWRECFTPIPEWADARQDPEHPPEYVMAPRSMAPDFPRLMFPDGYVGTLVSLAAMADYVGRTAVYERLPDQPEVLRRVWVCEEAAAPAAELEKFDAAPEPPVDAAGDPRPDWVGGGQWVDHFTGGHVDFDASTYTRPRGRVTKLAPWWDPQDMGTQWTRVDTLAEAAAKIGDDPNRSLTLGRLTAPAPEPPVDAAPGYTMSDVTPQPFDAAAYALRKEEERREFDRRIAYQTPWPQEEIDAAYERGRLARVQDEIARRTGR